MFIIEFLLLLDFRKMNLMWIQHTFQCINGRVEDDKKGAATTPNGAGGSHRSSYL